MKIYVLRHEERPNNPGFLTELTEFGKHKAMFSLKNTLKNISFTHVFSSPFLRVLQTIAPYVENNHYVNIEYGLAEGLHDPVFTSEDDFSIKETPCHLSNYESVVDINNYKYYENDDVIRNRVKTFYDDLIKNHKNENHVILLACHKCICNVLLENMTGLYHDMDDSYDMGKLTTVDENGEILWIN
tara:strand:+ start:248 stop:805 length:558 start_codon:yes stop_codon:yes gene_type:complete